MPDTIVTLLLLICLLQIKHMFADYFMQTRKMLEGRGQYFHIGRAQHSAIHAIGSILCFLVIGAPLVFVVTLALAEWVVHFHIDWGKARYCDGKDFDPYQAGFWRAAGVDQALHQLTYVGMLWAWLHFVAM